MGSEIRTDNTASGRVQRPPLVVMGWKCYLNCEALRCLVSTNFFLASVMCVCVYVLPRKVRICVTTSACPCIGTGVRVHIGVCFGVRVPDCMNERVIIFAADCFKSCQTVTLTSLSLWRPSRFNFSATFEYGRCTLRT